MDGSLITAVIVHAFNALPEFGVAALILVLGRVVFLRTTGFDAADETVRRGNPAAGVVLGAYLVGTGMALTGAFFGTTTEQESVLVHVGELAAEGGLVVLLLRLSIWVNDRFILTRFSVVKEIREDRNLGVAFCLAGSCLACALVLNGALEGFSAGFLFGLRDIVLFWLIGQAVLVLGGYLYQRLTRYDVHQLIEYDDNAAVGLGFGGFLVSLGVVVRSSLVGAGRGALGAELVQTVLLAAIGVVAVVAVNSLAMFLLMPKADYEQDVEMSGNLAVSIVAAGASVGVALLIGAALER